MDSLPPDTVPPAVRLRDQELREQELQAQIAELKQDKERLLGLLDQALTALTHREESDPARLTPRLPHAPARTAAKRPSEEFQPGTWAWLKNWFLNA